jgi:cyclophilin family peptidyl-prolyl cis-trans isomerase
LRRLAAAALLWSLAASAAGAVLPDGLYAEIVTPRGTITCQLEYARTPLTVTSFVGLAEGTLGPAPRKPFFDGLKFHRVVPGFVIQGGDPLGTGEGGPGYTFPDEFVPGLSNDAVGMLSMANDGPDTNGSQFFITLAPVGRLNYLHTVFGRTVGGCDVLPKVAQGDVMQVHIRRIGPAALAFRADDAAFAALEAKTAKYTGLASPGPKAHFDDPDKLLPTDPPRAQNFNYKLANFERATGARVYARVYATFVPGPAAATPAEFTEQLARTLGLADDGVLAVYFSATKTWSLSVGKTRLGWFVGRPAEVTLRLTKAAQDRETAKFLASAHQRELSYLALPTPALTTFLQFSAQQTKIAVDAVLDELLSKPLT